MIQTHGPRSRRPALSSMRSSCAAPQSPIAMGAGCSRQRMELRWMNAFSSLLKKTVRSSPASCLTGRWWMRRCSRVVELDRGKMPDKPRREDPKLLLEPAGKLNTPTLAHAPACASITSPLTKPSNKRPYVRTCVSHIERTRCCHEYQRNHVSLNFSNSRDGVEA